MNNRPTPETDACISAMRGESIFDLCKRLERERDELREANFAMRDLSKKIEQQRKEIVRLNGATSHAGGTPLKIALRERDEARAEWGKASMDAAQLLSEKTKVMAERDEAREELAEAKREAENLAKSIYRSEYSDNDTDWELLYSVAGVISQIDNMYAGVREQRDEAIRLLKLCADHTITTYQEEAEEFLKRIK